MVDGVIKQVKEIEMEVSTVKACTRKYADGILCMAANYGEVGEIYYKNSLLFVVVAVCCVTIYAEVKEIGRKR